MIIYKQKKSCACAAGPKCDATQKCLDEMLVAHWFTNEVICFDPLVAIGITEMEPVQLTDENR